MKNSFTMKSPPDSTEEDKKRRGMQPLSVSCLGTIDTSSTILILLIMTHSPSFPFATAQLLIIKRLLRRSWTEALELVRRVMHFALIWCT